MRTKRDDPENHPIKCSRCLEVYRLALTKKRPVLAPLCRDCFNKSPALEKEQVA
jgi:hypothetical protein